MALQGSSQRHVCVCVCVCVQSGCVGMARLCEGGRAMFSDGEPCQAWWFAFYARSRGVRVCGRFAMDPCQSQCQRPPRGGPETRVMCGLWTVVVLCPGGLYGVRGIDAHARATILEENGSVASRRVQGKEPEIFRVLLLGGMMSCSGYSTEKETLRSLEVEARRRCRRCCPLLSTIAAKPCWLLRRTPLRQIGHKGKCRLSWASLYNPKDLADWTPCVGAAKTLSQCLCL
ncbi:uncharacterized protein SETTUDRAFT_153136 [Exserohilum turcica Et28A]|uniref:Uncharacterized protein n=1 Tax=Exserohilum turcicum (strain 28A) TaxID=671987 RepID=R0J5J7_EXST2|nr:uncharacterized protein SETTUDRAFT_153136 [Exserohilum turcica Et28A]EOA92165.1 hypothetical protein SETTUDRAFT_153136 [Exserohilum turcica Et28A]